MSEIVHLIIKKDYAASLIEHLKNEKAIEIIEEDAIPIPEWQKKEVRKRIKDLQKNPDKLIGSAEAFKKINQMAK